MTSLGHVTVRRLTNLVTLMEPHPHSHTHLQQCDPTIDQSVALEVSSSQVEENLSVVKVVKLTKTILILQKKQQQQNKKQQQKTNKNPPNKNKNNNKKNNNNTSNTIIIIILIIKKYRIKNIWSPLGIEPKRSAATTTSQQTKHSNYVFILLRVLLCYSLTLDRPMEIFFFQRFFLSVVEFFYTASFSLSTDKKNL